MAISNIIHEWEKKQRQLINIAFDFNHAAEKLLTTLQVIYPDIYNHCNAEKLNKICNDWQNIFSKEGECHE